MPTKVLWVNAINPYAEIEYRYPPLGVGYLASSLRAHFGPDTFQFRVVNREVEEALTDFQPDIVGITTVTQNYSMAKKYARAIRQKRLPVIIGGIHISMLPSSLSPDMDVGVIGEGEETILELFELFMKKGNLDSEGVSQIRGIVYRNSGGSLHLTEKRPPLFPLDRISMPARDLLSIEKHSYLFSSRGCPFRCVFCASSRYWGPVRFFSAEYVVREIRELVRAYGVKLISFYDDLMIADGSRLKKIVSLLQREDFLSRVKFSLNARANLLDEGVVKLLKDMNVVSVGMGLESGNERVLRYLKGPHISVADNQAAIRLLKKYGIAANASFVIGSPDETEEEIGDTYRFIKTSGLSFVDAYVITPFPGTPIWEYAKSVGAVQDDMEWERLNVNYGTNPNPVILSQTLSKEAMDRLFAKFQRLRLFIAMKNILRHPFFWDICRLSARRMFNKLRKVHKRKGDKTLLEG
jgi:anaerobic magnesium-protoporphyrin IX monomethyl ester cyclase